MEHVEYHRSHMQALRHLADSSGTKNHLEAFLLTTKKRYSRVNQLSDTHYSCFIFKIKYNSRPILLERLTPPMPADCSGSTDHAKASLTQP